MQKVHMGKIYVSKNNMRQAASCCAKKAQWQNCDRHEHMHACMLMHSPCTQVSSSTISIDYAQNVAIRQNADGQEEKQKLVPDTTSGFGTCTWSDGTSYQSTVPNLMLEDRPPLRELLKKKPAAKKKEATKTVTKKRRKRTDSHSP